MFCYIWEFTVKPTHSDEFELAYGPEGQWAQLFRQAPGYIRTELLRDLVVENRCLTIDYWVDRQSYERFRLDFRAEFESLDDICEGYTESERRIGDFELH